MGLDIVPLARVSDTRVSFAYSGFGDFRRAIAAAIGIDLDAMEGFGGIGVWPDAEDEPLVHLLNHSDCDGELDYIACEKLGTRLREVLPLAFEGDPTNGDVITAPWYLAHGLELAAMCDGVVRGDYEVLLFS